MKILCCLRSFQIKAESVQQNLVLYFRQVGTLPLIDKNTIQCLLCGNIIIATTPSREKHMSHSILLLAASLLSCAVKKSPFINVKKIIHSSVDCILIKFLLNHFIWSYSFILDTQTHPIGQIIICAFIMSINLDINNVSEE